MMSLLTQVSIRKNFFFFKNLSKGINQNAAIGCIGDFDGDKYNDLFIIDGKDIHVYLWYHKQQQKKKKFKFYFYKGLEVIGNLEN